MTTAKTSNRVDNAGDGVTVAFAVPFRFINNSDLLVYVSTSTTEMLKVLDTDYSVVNNGDETGGTVTMNVAPAFGETWTALRATPKTQSTDYVNNDPFPAETHEAALDKLTLQVQDLSEEVGRSLTNPLTDTALTEIPADRASKFAAWDANKNIIAVSGSVPSLPVTSYASTLLDDPDAKTARETLGIFDMGFLSVREFGAVGDGVTDDTAAIQAAVNAAMSAGATLFFPNGTYLITDTIELLNVNFVKSWAMFGQSAMSTILLFRNSTPLKNMFNCEGDVNYLYFNGFYIKDETARTSRCFYLVDNTSQPGGPAWKHRFENLRIWAFKEGMRIEGGAAPADDTHQSEYLLSHMKFRNCETSLIYNNIQAVNHQLLGVDFENDDPADAAGKWPMIVFERGSVVNHTGGSVIGYGPYVTYTYPSSSGSAFQLSAQFMSRGIRMEARGEGPFISHDRSSDIGLSHFFALYFEGMTVVNTPAGVAPVLAEVGGRTHLEFNQCTANADMAVKAYMTTNLAGNGQFGQIVIEDCYRINYKRVSTVTAYGSAGIASTNFRAIPANITTKAVGERGTTDGSGYYNVESVAQTVYSGHWQIAAPKTLVYSKSDTGGFGSGADPYTFLINVPDGARPYKFRLLRDDYNAASAFVMDLYAVVSGTDYLVATITPTSGTGGHFEADIQTATGLVYYLNDGVNWDGKMKVKKSGTINGYVGLIMIDYM